MSRLDTGHARRSGSLSVVRPRRRRTNWTLGVLLVALVLALLVPSLAAAATAGPNYGTGTSVSAGAGTVAWTNPNRIGADDTSYATCDLGNGASSWRLFARDLGFAIPAGATINGIQVEINRQSSGQMPPLVRDNVVQLTKDGSALVGSNLAVTTTDWPTGSPQTRTYGSSTNLWGDVWTPAEVNATTFGVALQARNANNNRSRTATVDYIRVTVTYTVPTALTVTAIGVDKAYDRTTTATVTLSSSEVDPGDTVTYSYDDAQFDTKDVGTGKEVTVTGIAIGGADAGKYSLQNTTAAATADITPAELHVSGVTVPDKVYDGTTGADADFSGAALVGVIDDEDVTLDGDEATAAFADKNVGSDKAVTVSGFALAGDDAGNYILTQPAPTADITAAELTADGAVAVDKVYDGTTAVEVEFDEAALVGVVDDEDVSLDSSAYAAAFDTKDVGTGKDVTVTDLALAGDDAGNYILTQPALSADITPAELHVSGVTVPDKVYDGTTGADADFSGAALVGVIDDEDVTLDGDEATAAFADKNVGSDKAVTVSGFALAGDDAGNYILTQPAPTADITAAELTADASGVDKVYDGTTAAEVEFGSDDLVDGDEVTFTYSATFADKNVGTGIDITVEDISLGGADAGNYELQNTTAATAADITVAELTITARDQNKQVGREFTFAGTEFSVAGLAAGDAVTTVTFTCDGAAAAAAVGTYPIVPSDAVGTGLGNYSVAYENGTMTVSKAPVRVYKVGPFAKPLRQADTRRFNRGATVRVAFKVKDENGKSVTTAAPKLKVTRLNKTVLAARTVKYDKAKKMYVYSLKLKPSWKKGTYAVRVGLGAGSKGRAVNIRLVK